MKNNCLVVCVGALFLTGCTLPSATTSQSVPFVPLASPLQPSVGQEINLMRIDHLLQRRELTHGDKAKLFFERGLINDSLGLRSVAQIDFDRSLFFNPTQAEAYTMLGITHAQEANFDLAYDAFDAALELEPNFQLTYLNRGITLYYAGRYHLAERDLLSYYEQNMNQPYPIIWLYFVEVERYGEDKALENLNMRYQESDQTDFGWETVRLYLGEISEQELVKEIQNNSYSNQQLAQRLCEGYFYLAKRYQKYNKMNLASAVFKLAVASNTYNLIEHRYSLLELKKIAEKRREVESD